VKAAHRYFSYIRDLLSGLRDTESYDRQRLALSTAATLIGRKANFGTEVSDHAEELAALLTGLNDKYDLENFQEKRLQAMVALLVAEPLKMGQWFSKTFFDGDYSMGQRASILSTLGIGARELAGYRSEDATLTGAESVPKFPSKMLPERLHKIYAATMSPVDALSEKLERTMIAPMAAEAADKLSGPNVLKVRTFSSRMEVEKRRKKPIANELAKVVADGFFFPLTGRWWVHLKT
jgi:telomere length regulation protein